MKRVDFPLDKRNILRNSMGKKVYYRTRYLILNKGKQYAVVELRKTGNRHLFTEVLSARVISLPKDTRYVQESRIDTLNKPLLAEFASRFRKETVVIKGKFGHITFVHKPRFKRIRIVDVVPPFPAKLPSLVRSALETGEIHTPVKIEERLIDTNELARDVETEEVMFACKEGGGKVPGKKSLYLDQNPDVRNPTLIGCDRTKRVSKSLYGKDFPFIDICPKSHVKSKDEATLVKCCELQTGGFRREGKIAIVPWGATVGDVIGAMKYLLGEEN
ncbi:MAG: hypothetical protein ACE5KV_09410 [Thermoplasmata archaeon]